MTVPPEAMEQLEAAYRVPDAQPRRMREPGDDARYVARLLFWTATVATLAIATILGVVIAITVAVLT